MEVTIFYSWQSDSPNSTNRGFIQTALERAVKEIRNDVSIKVEPRIDKDTAGIPGSPNIPEAILEKINRCDIFLCDVSIINNRSKFRLTPNPNVLFELGYALKTLGGWERIIMVCNEAYGEIRNLPFDLPTRRVIPYSAAESLTDKSAERTNVSNKLRSQIGVMLPQFIAAGTVQGQEIIVQDRVIDEVLTRAAKLAKEKQYEVDRSNWLRSFDSIRDVANSVNDIFGQIDTKVQGNEGPFSMLGITLHREKFLRSVQTNEYGSQVEIKGLNENNPDRTTFSDLWLLQILYKKIPYIQGTNTTESIKESHFFPDLSASGEVVWKEKKGKPFSSQEVSDRCFQLLFSQMENPKPSKDEHTRTLMNAFRANNALRKQSNWEQ